MGTLFSGGGGVELAALDAGLVPVWGVEVDPEVVEVFNANFGVDHKPLDILKVRAKDFEVVDLIHASPPCVSASVASAAGEGGLDLAFADKVVEFLEVLRPSFFSLENVFPYRNFRSFQRIKFCLLRLGFEVSFWHLNFSEFGVPQSRRRLVLLASRVHDALPPLRRVDADVGWFGAVEDLLDDLPETEFAAWQVRRLGELGWFGSGLLPSDNSGARTFSVRRVDEPAQTRSTASSGVAFLLGGQSNAFLLKLGDPASTVRAGRSGDEKAWIMGAGKYSAPRLEDEPCMTVTSNFNQVTGVRAWLECGRVVKMTPRANARFQSFPDSYVLPDGVGLAHKSTSCGSASILCVVGLF